MVSGTRAADADRDGASAASRAGSAAADATDKLLPDTGTISGPSTQSKSFAASAMLRSA